MTELLPTKPEFPLIVVNPRFVEGRCDKGSIKRFYWMTEAGLASGAFAKDTFVFDNKGRKFEITNVRFIRRTYDFTGIFYKRNHIKIEFDYQYLEQLTFEDIRAKVLDHICSKRWYGQTGANQAQFRTLTNECSDMQQLSKHVSFYGKWLR